jgi:hypothetical protein
LGLACSIFLHGSERVFKNYKLSWASSKPASIFFSKSLKPGR